MAAAEGSAAAGETAEGEDAAEAESQAKALEVAIANDPEVQDIVDRIEAAKADGTLDQVMEDIRENNPDQLKWAEIAVRR